MGLSVRVFLQSLIKKSLIDIYVFLFYLLTIFYSINCFYNEFIVVKISIGKLKNIVLVNLLKSKKINIYFHLLNNS